MKKLMTVMLGLGLILGSASFAFADDTMKDTTKTKKMKKSKTRKSKTTETTTSTPSGK